jgi:hypothetical protein
MMVARTGVTQNLLNSPIQTQVNGPIMLLALYQWVYERVFVMNVFNRTLEIESILVLMGFKISFTAVFYQLDNK